jgi:hypothetical protein
MPVLPPFSKLRANYPAKSSIPAKALLDSIGGEVRASLRDNVNTCALRMSDCLNKSGAPLVHLAGLYALSGEAAATPSIGHRPGPQKPRFIVRVRDMMTYLQRVFGPGHTVYDARTEPKAIHLNGRKHVQGIIVFEWLGPPREFGATGHVDLFSILDRGANAAPQFVPACDGECFWLTDAGPMVAHLWETTS